MKATIFLILGLPIAASGYDPLGIPAGATVTVEERVVRDTARDREIPLRIYLPAAEEEAPVVLFSHGLGGSNRGCSYLGEHWAKRGYVAVFVQHPGSDTAVWKGAPRARRMEAMKAAASAGNFVLRTGDIPAALDALEEWNRREKDRLAGRLDLGKVAMAGHSFGAVTAQAVGGQDFGRLGQRFTDPRIDAAIALSPSMPGRRNGASSFEAVSIPWMLMTGTKDVSPIGGASVEERLAVFPALPPGGKYLLVLKDAEHSAFSDRALPGDREPRNPNHHRAIRALTTAFLDAWLKDDPAAMRWLDGPQARSVLEDEDRWERK